MSEDLEAENERLRARVEELLVSNNAYLEEARAARRGQHAADLRAQFLSIELSKELSGHDRVRHVKTGHEYLVIDDNVISATNGSEDGVRLVVYMDPATGQRFARHHEEFVAEVPNPNRALPRLVRRFQPLNRTGFHNGQDRRRG